MTDREKTKKQVRQLYPDKRQRNRFYRRLKRFSIRPIINKKVSDTQKMYVIFTLADGTQQAHFIGEYPTIK